MEIAHYRASSYLTRRPGDRWACITSSLTRASFEQAERFDL